MISVPLAPVRVNGRSTRCQSRRVLLVLAQQRRPRHAGSAQWRKPMLKRTPPNGKNGKKHNGGGKSGKRPARVKELPKITVQTDTREILAHAAKEKRDDYFIVD